MPDKTPSNFKKEIDDYIETALGKFRSEGKHIINQTLNHLNRKIDVFMEKYEKDSHKHLTKALKEMSSFCKKIDQLEETFLIMFTNIKRNQFLYSHYPEDWWDENYLHIKEKMKKENKDYKKAVS
jgi:hypothetical protein